MEQFSLVSLRLEHWPWVRSRIYLPLSEDTTGVIALRGAEIIAVVVFDRFTRSSCQAHIVIEDPRITRRLLRKSFKYVFETCNLMNIYATIPASNPKSLRFTEWIGFLDVGRVKDAVTDKEDLADLVIKEFTQQAYKQSIWPSKAEDVLAA